MADIQFTGDIVINTKEAEKSIANLSKQINDVFAQTGKMMNAALQTTNFGFSGILPGYRSAIEQTEKIISEHKKKIPKIGEKSTEEEIAIHNAALARVNRADEAVKQLKALEKFMRSASKYDALYSNISGLQNLTTQDAIDPATGLGRYGVYQRYANRFLGILYSGNLAFPGIINQAVLERGEFYRDINRKTGSLNRSALRYVQDKAYTESSLSRAGDYLLMTGQGGLQELSDIYGFDLGSDSSSVPSRVSAKAQNILTRWAQLGLSAKEHKDIILRGGLSKSAKAAEIDTYAQYMRDFISLQKKLFPEEKGIHDSLKKLLKTDLLKFKGGGYGGAGSGIWTAIGAKAAKDIFRTAGDMLESYWGESITRNAYSSREAYLSRWTKGEKIVGSVVGGVIGGLIGGAPGAGIGYSAGGEVLSMFGKYNETKYKADIKSSTDMLGRIRNQALWGSSYNTYFAKALTDIGIANGESAMSGLADKSMGFRARMMLGQVGEQEMLYMSMMPNYYAALMAGITGPSLLNIYKRDLDAIGDPSMRYLVGQSIGNTEAFAAARSPYFNAIYSSTAGVTGAYEGALSRVQGGFVAGRMTAAMETLTRDFSEIFASVRRGDSTIYQGPGKNQLYQEALDQYKFLTGERNLTVIVNVDGEEIKRSVVNQDQLYTNDLQLYTVGG